jgi:hypothetical protein
MEKRNNMTPDRELTKEELQKLINEAAEGEIGWSSFHSRDRNRLRWRQGCGIVILLLMWKSILVMERSFLTVQHGI